MHGYTCTYQDVVWSKNKDTVFKNNRPHNVFRFRTQQIYNPRVPYTILCCLFLLLLQFSLKTAGLYKATISDDRGKDMSQIDISGKGKHIFLT